MRRSRRGRLLNWGILIIVYSCISIFITGQSPTEPSAVGSEAEMEMNLNVLGTATDFDESSPVSGTEFLVDDETSTTATTHHHHHHHPHPTLRPRRQNCTPPAIEQFPRPLMGPFARRHGGLVIHLLVAIFTFLGLAIVCDEYFVSSLDRICEELKLSPDVAGATFMAAGSSAPELATVIIGVFFAKDDIGISGVIGSAVFNIMFVISVCALCSGMVCQLNWWPLVRDCFFYSISILLMLIVIIDDRISYIEALIMMIFYVIYCVTLHFNPYLEKWALGLKLPIKLPTKEEQSALVTYKNIPETSYTQGSDQQQQQTVLDQPPQVPPQSAEPDYTAYMDPNVSWDPNAAWGDDNKGPAPSAPSASSALDWGAPAAPTNSWGAPTAPTNSWGNGQENYGYDQTGQPTEYQNAEAPPQAPEKQQAVQSAQPGGPDYYKSKDPKLQEHTNPLEKPTDGGIFAVACWGVVYPIHYMCRITMPDCKTEKYRNWYPFTFMISMVWISFYSYFMVWMITIIGSTLGIPDTVMGLTFVAAGVSVPDALSSIAVIKEGYGDMAVSNAVGSNVFDILICLGLPWFIQTAIIAPGTYVNVISKGLTYSTLSLLSTVIFLLVSVHMNGWKLDKRLGIILMIWYLFFITLASLYELNVFGQLNPPECFSFY